MATLASVPLPKLVDALRRGYSFEAFLNDLVAGVTVGLVALPLAMAFAIASGVPPQNGLYCAVVAGFIISALGGSSTQIGGPTGAFVVVVAGIVERLRPRRAVHVHADGRRHPHSSRGHRSWHGGQVHSAFRGDRVHERHRRPDREYADSRLLWPAGRQPSRATSSDARRC